MKRSLHTLLTLSLLLGALCLAAPAPLHAQSAGGSTPNVQRDLNRAKQRAKGFVGKTSPDTIHSADGKNEDAGEVARSFRDSTVNDTWLLAAWDWASGHVMRFWGWSSTKVRNVLVNDFEVENANGGRLAKQLLLLTIMLLSGCLSAGIAQMRRHNGLLWFFAGFFGIAVAPALQLYFQGIRGTKKRRAERDSEREAEAARQQEEEVTRQLIAQAEGQEAATGEEAADGAESQTAAAEAEAPQWTPEYLHSIMRKEDGTPAGPWHVRYNGVDVTVLEILEVQPQFVQTRLINAAGKAMVGRIPLAKLECWEDTVLPE